METGNEAAVNDRTYRTRSSSEIKGFMDPYGTHLPVLIECCLHSTGPILELGIGTNSTPILHAFANCGRTVMSVDHDAGWFSKFECLYRDNSLHQFRFVHSYDEIQPNLMRSQWGVALVDHAPMERRVVELERLQGNAQLIVVHDTEDPRYQYEPVLKQFNYRRDCKRFRPWVSVVSDTDSLEWLK